MSHQQFNQIKDKQQVVNKQLDQQLLYIGVDIGFDYNQDYLSQYNNFAQNNNDPLLKQYNNQNEQFFHNNDDQNDNNINYPKHQQDIFINQIQNDQKSSQKQYIYRKGQRQRQRQAQIQRQGQRYRPIKQQKQRPIKQQRIRQIQQKIQKLIQPQRQEDIRQQSNQKKNSQVRKRCICKKTQCLKMYCQCFASNLPCGQDCSCLNCKNTPQHQKQIFQAKLMIREKGIVGLHSCSLSQKRCNCKKSHCLKKYCQCYNSGVKCSEGCKCIDCKNCQNPFVQQNNPSSKPKQAKFQKKIKKNLKK